MGKKKVRLMIYDTYGDLSGNTVPLDISGEDHDKLIEESRQELINSYGFMYDDDKNGGGNLLTGTRARSVTSLTDATVENETKKAAAYKKIIYWSKDVETEGLPMYGKLAVTGTMFMWGVTESKWVYNRPEVLFGGEIATKLARRVRRGVPQVDETKKDGQNLQFLKKNIELFTNEEEIVWDVKGEIEGLEELCKAMNREYVSGELSKEEFDYNEEIEYGSESIGLDLSDLDEPEVKETTAEMDTIELGDTFDWLNTIADDSIDLLLTDPPYNVSEDTKEGSIFGNRGVNLNFGDWDFGFDTRRWINQVAPKVKQGGTAAIFNSFKNMEIMARVLEDHYGYTIIGMAYWSKTNPVPHLLDRVPLNGIESYLLAFRGEAKDFKVNLSKVKEAVYRPRFKDYVVTDNHYHSSHADQRERFHTTQKPELLFKEIIDMYTDVGDVVLETFSGSGTAPKGCEDLGRHYYAVERDETYHKKSLERLGNSSSKRRFLL